MKIFKWIIVAAVVGPLPVLALYAYRKNKYLGTAAFAGVTFFYSIQLYILYATLKAKGII